MMLILMLEIIIMLQITVWCNYADYNDDDLNADVSHDDYDDDDNDDDNDYADDCDSDDE
ncbi:hypothetical protein DPMN_171312 [Dreissena polymorpha]|uniref:Uncharacterized protein n=1 Tax=Dreissena polymorpha TaxID=45954 RepID=A0A9D4DYY4_DREPO|nr:hypothetical protein DPMN_171312 [Dreissena polymorpha]